MTPSRWTRLLSLLLLATSPSLRAQLTSRIYDNTAQWGTPVEERLVEQMEWKSFDNTTTGPCSGELIGSLTFVDSSTWLQFNCTFQSTLTAWVWLDGHLVCQDGHTYDTTTYNPHSSPLRVRRGRVYPLRAHVTSQVCEAARLSVSWVNLSNTKDSHPRTTTTTTTKSATNAILSPRLPVYEQHREELQRSLRSGWGNWLH